MKRIKLFVFSFLVGTLCLQCNPKQAKELLPLPILGRTAYDSTAQKEVVQPIPEFAFYNQDSVLVTNKTLAGKVYVTDFFFTSCPTICPIMKGQMLRVYNQYKTNDKVMLVSHTIDPRHDGVPTLKRYSEKLGVDASKWHFLTGNQDVIYELAYDYMVSAAEDSTAPGGYIHSGAFILIDQKGYIRGYYDGTQEIDVDALLVDIVRLLKDEVTQQ